jgi:hypothetical protein
MNTKKKTKRFAEGGNIGYTDQEATDLMENNIVPKPRASTYSGIMASGDTSGWTKDELETLKANKAAERKPVRKPAVKKAAPATTNASMPDYEAGAAPLKTKPIASTAEGKKVPQRMGKRYAGQDGGDTFKYKKGGAVKVRGCGIAQRGLTKGKYC